MKLRAALAGAALLMTAGAAGLVAGPADAATTSAHPTTTMHRQHPCTRTSSGTCIKGGGFCPQASYNHSGWDAKGRRYVCKGDRTHPHWMVP